MNKKGFSIYMMVLTTMVMLLGCSKDKVDRMTSLPIVFENFNSNDKAYIENGYACWEDGDEVRISKSSDGGSSYRSYNGTISLQYLNGAPSATASASEFSTAADDTVNVAYPRGLFSSETIDENIDVNMPSVYVYQVSNGKQKIESPMIGRVGIVEFNEGDPNPNVLKLKNLCCLLRIKLDAPATGAFVVDTIIVVNTTHTTAMSGSATISHSFGNDPTLSMSSGSESTYDRVILDLSSSAVALNETKYFYIPIPPQAHGQEFKIYAHNQVTGHWSYNTIQSRKSIPGNTIATIQGPSTDDEADYTFFKYLVNNTNSSKIDLGVTPTNTMKMEITFAVPSGNMASSQYYTGSRPGGAETQIYFGLSASGNDSKFRAHFCSYPQGIANYVMSTMNREENVKYRQTIEVKAARDSANWYYAKVIFEKFNPQGDAVVAIEEHRTASKYGGIPEGATSVNVFSLGQVYQPKMKLYSYRIWNNGSLIHNFVPAQNRSHVSGVYDMVDNTFITGTETFTAADD